MWLSTRKVGESKVRIVDSIATFVLGATLCATLLVHAWHCYLAPAWDPILHELSADGKYFLSLSKVGMRIHDAQSGREVDRVCFAHPSPSKLDLMTLYCGELHLAETSAEDEFQLWYGTDEDLIHPRVLMSDSERYVAAVLPAGYFVLWDRQRGAFHTHIDSEHYFLDASIDDERGVLVVDAVRAPEHSGMYSQLTRDEADEIADSLPRSSAPKSLDVLRFRLEDASELAATNIPNAGARLDGDANLRYRFDAESEELCISVWDHFPECGPAREIKTKEGGFPACREGHLFAVHDHGNELEMKCLTTGCEPTRCLAVPESFQRFHIRWNAARNAAWVVSDGPQMRIAVWGESETPRVYETSGYCVDGGKRAKDPLGQPVQRLASLYGEIIDLPLCADCKVSSRRLELKPYAGSFRSAVAICWSVSFLWTAMALWHGRLLKHGGWLMLLMVALWPAALAAVQLCIEEAPTGFQRAFMVAAAMSLIGFIGAMGALRSTASLRCGVVCVCAILAGLLLLDAAHRVHGYRNFQQPGGTMGCVGT